jgi:polar amino acid transport system substrate-binding protein
MFPKKKFYYKIIILLLFLLTDKISFAKEYQHIKICSESGFLPYEMKTISGNWIGYEITLLTKFAESTERQYSIKDMKFKDLLPALAKGKDCDVVASAVGLTPGRAENIIYSDPIYSSAYAGLIRIEDKEKYTSFNDLNKSSVTFVAESSTEAERYVRSIYTKAKIILSENNQTTIENLLTKKADIYLDDSVSLAVIFKKYSDRLYFIKPTISSLFNINIFPNNTYDPIAFVFRDRDENLRNEFNIFFNNLKKSGELKKIQKYYFDDMNWMTEFKLKDNF